MRVLVVDDEAPARRRLLRMLASLDGIEVVGEAADGDAALATIDAARPDVVLLDIDMPGLDGLAAAELARDVAIVFTTAHAQHAAKAFELDAVDYLLKPITRARLHKALERAHRRGRPSGSARISARCGATVHLFDARDVARFSAADKYTRFTQSGREYLLDESLASLERRLLPHGFARVHRAELINLARVRALHGEGAATTVELDDGSQAPVSRRLLSDLKKRLGLG